MVILKPISPDTQTEYVHLYLPKNTLIYSFFQDLLFRNVCAIISKLYQDNCACVRACRPISVFISTHTPTHTLCSLDACRLRFISTHHPDTEAYPCGCWCVRLAVALIQSDFPSARAPLCVLGARSARGMSLWPWHRTARYNHTEY